MRTWVLLGTLIVYSLCVVPVFAQDKDLEERIKRLEQSIQQLEKKEEREREGMRPDVQAPEIIRPAEPPTEPGIGPLPDVAKDLRREKQAPLSFGSTGSGRLVYAKPFVASPKAIVGGYMDFFYTNYRKGSIDNGAGPGSPGIGSTSSSFDNQRFVPFIYADITEHVKMAAELEFEHGIRETSGDGREIEFGVEFATIDYLINEPVNVRAGIILLPVGKFNLLHDSPLNDVGPRPLVDQFIIPTTMSETGAGFYGTFYPTRLSKLDYEAYVTTGPNGYNAAGDPLINEANGTRGSRQRSSFASDGLDNNNGKAVVGRVAFSPRLGIEIAGSGYYGSYDPASKRALSIMALDWTLQRGPFELIGEAAWSYAKNNSRDLAGAPIIDPSTGRLFPQRGSGYYIQGNYHFMPLWLTRLAPTHFHEGSTFTAVLRYDRINTNMDAPNSEAAQEKLTLGLNWRPVEDTVYRFAYEFNTRGIDQSTGRPVTGNNAVILSVATYF